MQPPAPGGLPRALFEERRGLRGRELREVPVGEACHEPPRGAAHLALEEGPAPEGHQGAPPGLGRQRSMTLPARRVRESDGLLSGDLFGGRSRARTPPPGLVSQGSRRAQTPPPGSVSWKPGV